MSGSASFRATPHLPSGAYERLISSNISSNSQCKPIDRTSPHLDEPMALILRAPVIQHNHRSGLLDRLQIRGGILFAENAFCAVEPFNDEREGDVVTGRKNKLMSGGGPVDVHGRVGRKYPLHNGG